MLCGSIKLTIKNAIRNLFRMDGKIILKLSVFNLNRKSVGLVPYSTDYESSIVSPMSIWQGMSSSWIGISRPQSKWVRKSIIAPTPTTKCNSTKISKKCSEGQDWQKRTSSMLSNMAKIQNLSWDRSIAANSRTLLPISIRRRIPMGYPSNAEISWKCRSTTSLTWLILLSSTWSGPMSWGSWSKIFMEFIAKRIKILILIDAYSSCSNFAESSTRA